MDMRQYDPAIGRWVVQDPVTHFDYSPYSAFDNNPIYFADPSGADSCASCDSFGRQTIENGRYISVSERQERAKNAGGDNPKETWSQKSFRENITSFITTLDNQNKGDLSEKKSDANVDAYELFYQWIMGKGSSTRNFDQNSTMGQQMLQATEILAAIDKAASNGKDTPAPARILSCVMLLNQNILYLR